jgi:peptidoglycan hydrolase CwlO-like protein
MSKKDDSINCLPHDHQESTRELSIMRGMLPKVSEERDKLWEKVKQISAENMLLNSDIEVLMEKILTLDTDILIKKGQISILQEERDKRPCLYGSPDTIFCT